MNLAALRTPVASVPANLMPAATEDEVVRVLRTLEPCSVRTLGLRLGRTGSGLGAKMLRLEAAGQVIRVGVQTGSRGGSPAILWRTA
jgi:hypothetical protein